MEWFERSCGSIIFNYLCQLFRKCDKLYLWQYLVGLDWIIEYFDFALFIESLIVSRRRLYSSNVAVLYA